MNKTLKSIIDEYVKELGYANWNELGYSCTSMEEYEDHLLEIMDRAQVAVSRLHALGIKPSMFYFQSDVRQTRKNILNNTLKKK